MVRLIAASVLIGVTADHWWQLLILIVAVLLAYSDGKKSAAKASLPNPEIG